MLKQDPPWIKAVSLHYSLWKDIAKPHGTARSLQLLYLSIHILVCYACVIFTNLISQQQCQPCNRITQRSTSNFLIQVTWSHIWYLQLYSLVQDSHRAVISYWLVTTLSLNFSIGLEVALKLMGRTDLQRNPTVFHFSWCPTLAVSPP